MAASAPRGVRPFENYEQRLRKLEQKQRAPLLTPPPKDTKAPLISPTRSDDARILVKNIRVEGATLLSKSVIKRLVRPFEGQRLTLIEINSILQVITNAYAEKGYVTSRAVLEPQDLSTGTLVVRVIEGVVEDIKLTPQSTMEQGQLLTIFPWVKGSKLNLRDIEQGMDQLNRLPSNEATMTIEPGTDLGMSQVVINNVQDRTWRILSGYDNFGTETTGIAQYTLGFEKDNYLGANDQFLLYYTANVPPIGDNFKNKWDGNSSSITGLFSIPFGYWLFSGNFSYFSYSSKIYGMNQEYLTSGSTGSFRFALDRVIWRGTNGKLSLGTFYQYRDVINSIEDIKLLGSSYSLSTTGLMASYVQRFLGGVFTLQIDHTWGLPHMSKSIYGQISDTTPVTQFEKTSATLGWYRPFNIGEQSFVWNVSAFGQTSRQTLYGPERIYLGSVYTVRGFSDTPLGGDQGGYVRNEIAWNIPYTWWSMLTPQVDNIQIFGGWDVG